MPLTSIPSDRLIDYKKEQTRKTTIHAHLIFFIVFSAYYIIYYCMYTDGILYILLFYA